MDRGTSCYFVFLFSHAIQVSLLPNKKMLEQKWLKRKKLMKYSGTPIAQAACIVQFGISSSVFDVEM